jgi:6-phosphogluconolactonase
MEKLSRRNFLQILSAAALAAAAAPSLAKPLFAAPGGRRVFVGSNTPDGILAYDWEPATGELTPAGVAARLANVDWITFSPKREFLYAASEVDSFNGKPTGEVASFSVENGKLHPLSAQNSASVGTCHVAWIIQRPRAAGGRLRRRQRGQLSSDRGQAEPRVWTEHYTGHGPNKDRQQSAHAHFASFSPDNRFAYINDLGMDCIHIYKLNAATAMLTPPGLTTPSPAQGRARCTSIPTATQPTPSTNWTRPWTCWSGARQTAA